MKKHTTARGLLAVLAASAALALTWLSGGPARAARRPAISECEGDACAQVAVAFDESRQQYRARNNSADRWAKVSAGNLAAAGACLAPGAAEYLPLKSIVSPYRAEFAEPRCGAPDSYGAPPAP